MLDEKIMRKVCFERFEGACYHKKINDKEVILTEESGVLVFMVPCASVTVDNENEINGFVCEQFLENDKIKSVFGARELKIECESVSVVEEEEIISSVMKKIEVILEKYDMLPVCTCCGRILPIELKVIDGTANTVCSVCKGSMDFEKSKDKIIEQNRRKYADEYGIGGIQKRPVKASIKAGFLGGFYTCIFGALYMAFLWVFFGPLVHLGFGLMGAIAGFFTIRKCNQINHIPAWEKFALSTVSAFVTLFLISGVTFLILNPLIFHGEFLTMFYSRIYDLGHPIVYMVVLGIGTFFLSEWLFGFMFPGRRVK